MSGQGVTNYQTEKPTYGFSASTTEFDDALIHRGIITQEQAIFSKGATSDVAERIVALQHAPQQAAIDERPSQDGGSGDDDDDYLLDDEDDAFMNRYRLQRLEELRQQESTVKAKQQEYGEPILISRDEWSRHVNTDSEKVWVVVCLTSCDTERTGKVEQAVCKLAPTYRDTKFVLIPSKMAIANWPDENLPSIFLYRHGKMQREIVRMNPETNEEGLEDILREAGVL
jgi:hypothetical protein